MLLLNLVRISLVLVLSCVVSATLKCDAHWTLNSGVCFQFNDTRKSWINALQDCRNKGGDLATIDTNAKHSFVINRIGINEYWFGLNDTSNNGRFLWSATNVLSTFFKWCPGQPTETGVVNCVEYKNRCWSVKNRVTPLKYICQKLPETIVKQTTESLAPSITTTTEKSTISETTSTTDKSTANPTHKPPTTDKQPTTAYKFATTDKYITTENFTTTNKPFTADKTTTVTSLARDKSTPTTINTLKTLAASFTSTTTQGTSSSHYATKDNRLITKTGFIFSLTPKVDITNASQMASKARMTTDVTKTAVSYSSDRGVLTTSNFTNVVKYLPQSPTETSNLALITGVTTAGVVLMIAILVVVLVVQARIRKSSSKVRKHLNPIQNVYVNNSLDDDANISYNSVRLDEVHGASKQSARVTTKEPMYDQEYDLVLVNAFGDSSEIYK